MTNQRDGETICCPKTSRHEGDVVGCGSINIIEDANEPGVFDCLDCGIFFTLDAAESNGHDHKM